MEEMNNTYRKVGYALLIAGILDICLMIWAISNKQGYSSSFNIFAVIAGIFLIKGSVKTARIVRWFSAFLLLAFGALLIIYPMIMPIDLLIVQFKLNATNILLSLMFSSVLLGFIFWVYKQLSNQESLASLEAAGYKTGKPKSALYVVVGMFIIGLAMVIPAFTGESATKALMLAKEQYDPDYKYHLTNLNFSGDHVNAIIIAYNNETVQNVKVEW